MPSNGTWICVDCRYASKYMTLCPYCHEEMLGMGTRWSPPKRSDRRAWKRIKNGEVLWDRRRKRKRNLKDFKIRYEYRRIPIEDPEPIECDHEGCRLMHSYRLFRIERVPGSGKEYTNYNRSPDVDLGG